MAIMWGVKSFLAATVAFSALHSTGGRVPNMVEIQGDVIVAGLFSIQETKDGLCSNVNVQSVMNFEAIRWYLDNLNSSASLPFRIGLLAYKTCGIQGKGTESVADIISRSRIARDSNGANHSHIIGVIGPELNYEAEVVSYAISSLYPDDQLLQIGFSTKAEVLGDKNVHANFYRVIPNDKVEVKVMAKAVEKLGWTRFAIVYESNKYDENSAYALKSAVEEIGICVPFIKVVNVTSSGDIDQYEIGTLVQELLVSYLPPVNGAVFFGTADRAQLIILKANSRQIEPLPIFFMSGGIELNKNVFYDGNTLISKALGSYAVSSTFKKVTEFYKHWTSLFQNTSKLLELSYFNPWLLDAFEKVSKCRPSPAYLCTGLTDIQMQNSSIVFSVYTRYALLAAHALAKTLISVIKSKCDNKTQICQTILDSFKPKFMSERLKSITFDTEKDFDWRVPSLSDKFSFNGSGEVVLLNETPEFELYNFQKGSKTSNSVDFEKIGSYKDEDLTLKTEAIRDYDKNQQELFWPNIRRAECPKSNTCYDCISRDIPDLMIHLAGDLYFVALMPVHDKNSVLDCNGIRAINGYQLVEAFNYVMKKFRVDGEYSYIFGNNISIGLIILNTCNSGLIAKRKILEIHSKGVPNGQTTIDLRKRVLGYVGELGSTVSIGAAQVLSQLGYVQISYASTSPQLSSRSDFPYFMRVVTPDNKQAYVMVELITQLNSEYVQLIYSDETYGRGGRDSLLVATKGKKVCIVQPPISVKDSIDENFSGVYEILRRNPQAKFVIVFMRSHLVVLLMSKLLSQMKPGEFIFIGSEAWGKNVDVLKVDNADNVIGSFTVAMEMSSKEVLGNNIKGLFPARNGSTPWMQDYLEKKFSCYFNWSYNKANALLCTQDKIKELELEGWVMFAANAAISLLLGAGKFLSSKCPKWTGVLCDNYITDPSGLVQEINKVTLDLHGTGIPVKVFDSNGDGNIGYTIYNIQRKDNTINYEKVGLYMQDAGMTFIKKNVKYPNDVPVVSPCPNTQACQACFSDSSPPPAEILKQSDVAIPVLGALVGVLGSAFIGVILGIILCRRRNTKNNNTYLTATYEGPQRADNPSGSEFPFDDRLTPPGSCSIAPSHEKI